MPIATLALGPATASPGSQTYDLGHFGYTYTGFRSLDRFVAQLGDRPVGLISWPGGTIVESMPDRFDLGFDGLFNPTLDRPGLAEMMALARDKGAALSVTLPTLRYVGQDDDLHADLHDFMTDLLSGQYGPLPDRLIFEVGSEFYDSFSDLPDPAAAYGHTANLMVGDIAAALTDPAVNLIGADIDIAVQSGRTLIEDEAIRHALTPSNLAEVDLVIHHRFALTAEGIDASADRIDDLLDHWASDALHAGGDAPDLMLGSYNVGSYTRAEALADYLAQHSAAGHPVDPSSIDLATRNNADFERFWQEALALRDYGPEHPRVILEMLSEYGAGGVDLASIYGTDMVHPGHLSWQDTSGAPVHFIGQDMLDMLAQSLPGTRPLDLAVSNGPDDPFWVYGFADADKVVLFLSADDLPPGEVKLDLSALGPGFTTLRGDTLLAEVPPDWMDRFGIPDTPLVDESPEAAVYTLGHHAPLTPDLSPDGIVTLRIDQPHQTIRLALARTDLGAAEMADWGMGPDVALDPAWFDDPDTGDLHDLPPPDDPADTDPTEGDMADDSLTPHDGGGAAAGLLALLLLAPLALLAA